MILSYAAMGVHNVQLKKMQKQQKSPKMQDNVFKMAHEWVKKVGDGI